MPKKVDDECAALEQFKRVFNKRYCQQKVGPDFTTKIFSEAVKEAFCCATENRKAMGNFYLKSFV